MAVSIPKSARSVVPPSTTSSAPVAPGARANAARKSAAVSPSALWSQPIQGEWSLNKSGGLSDPVNLYLHGTLDQVKQDLQKAGWTQARPRNLETSVAFGLAAIPGWIEEKVVGLWDKLTGRHDKLSPSDPLNHEINSEPMDNLYYQGKSQVVGFEKNNDPFGGRDHLRVFATGKVDAQGRPVWAVAASRDTGIHFDIHRWKTAFFNHSVQINADLERNTVLKDLRASGTVSEAQPFQASWQKVSDTHLHSKDGRVYDVLLK